LKILKNYAHLKSAYGMVIKKTTHSVVAYLINTP